MCFHWVHSSGHWLQFPSFCPRRHSPVVVLLSSDSVSCLTRLWPTSDPRVSLAITSQPHVNSSASTPSQSRRYLLGSPSPCLDYLRSEPTTNKASSLHKTHSGSIETKCVTFPVPPLTDGLPSVWNSPVRSSFCVLRSWPSPP